MMNEPVKNMKRARSAILRALDDDLSDSDEARDELRSIQVTVMILAHRLGMDLMSEDTAGLMSAIELNDGTRRCTGVRAGAGDRCTRLGDWLGEDDGRLFRCRSHRETGP